MNGTEPRFVDLDALESLNPDPIVFKVGGRQLSLGELPHAELMAVIDAAQDAVGVATQASADEDVEGIRRAGDVTVDIVMRMFLPFNDWLTRAFVEALSERKIVFLLQHGIKSQHEFTTSLEVPELPPTRAVQRRAAREAVAKVKQRRNGVTSIAS